jgi:hypothetical protein
MSTTIAILHRYAQESRAESPRLHPYSPMNAHACIEAYFSAFLGQT